jgi:hypothetical protein
MYLNNMRHSDEGTLRYMRTDLRFCKASGVVVTQKPSWSTTLAFFSRWSQKEIQDMMQLVLTGEQ